MKDSFYILSLKAKECFDRYGLDAVMVGRAIFGRPWISKEIMDGLQPSRSCQAHEVVRLVGI